MESFKLIAEISDKPLFLLDGEGNVLGFNKQASDMYSLCAADTGKMTICSLCSKTCRMSSFSSLFSGGFKQKITHGTVHNTPAGDSVRVMLELYPFSVPEYGSEERLVCAVRQADGAADCANGSVNMPDMLNSLSSMVYVIDPADNSVLYANSHALSVLGIKSGWKGEKCWKVIHGSDEKCSFCSCGTENFSEVRTDEVMNRRNGRWYLKTGRLIHWENGQTARLIIAHDIDERKKAELLKDDVERIMRHDLKTPLNSIYLLGQALESSGESEDTRFFASKIIESCFQLNAMINLSQVLYSLEKNDYTILKREVLLNELLGRVCTHLEGLAASHRVNLKKVFPAGFFGGFMIYADDLLIYSCLSNLVRNAIEASPEGESVIIKCEKLDDRDVITVSNRGNVHPEIVGRFFDKYVTKGKAGGTGLGTYSARLLTEAHGGSISLNTGEGVTYITVSLPAD
jgi:nitrogen-specific signal transduction histidine kinase